MMSSWFYHISPFFLPGLSYHIISYDMIWYDIVSHHNISYDIVSYHTISYNLISHHIISYHIISITSYHIISYFHIIIPYISYIPYKISYYHTHWHQWLCTSLTIIRYAIVLTRWNPSSLCRFKSSTRKEHGDWKQSPIYMAVTLAKSSGPSQEK